MVTTSLCVTSTSPPPPITDQALLLPKRQNRCALNAPDLNLSRRTKGCFQLTNHCGNLATSSALLHRQTQHPEVHLGHQHYRRLFHQQNPKMTYISQLRSSQCTYPLFSNLHVLLLPQRKPAESGRDQVSTGCPRRCNGSKGRANQQQTNIKSCNLL